MTLGAAAPSARIPSDLLADCIAFLRARAEVERRVFLPVGALAPRGAVAVVPARAARAAARMRADSLSPPPVAAPPRDLDAFHAQIAECQRCALGRTRTRFVFGVGNPHADLMLIGEAPGREEDRQGIPFVGAAGELLTKILASIGLRRDDVYIANVLKCRPPGNRDPEPEEVASCRPYLVEQIRLVAPRMLCALGRFAAHLLTGEDAALSRLRGGAHAFDGIPVLVTYHPSALLRSPSLKRPTWEDMKRLRGELDRLGPR
jgi:DNA polymerase